MRASVWASTALVGSIEHEELGVREQRASEHEPLALTARERPPALVDPRVEAVREALEHVTGVGDGERVEDRLVRVGMPPRVELAAKLAREEDGVLLADDDETPDGVQRERLERLIAEDDPVAGRHPPEPPGDRRGLRRHGRDEAGEEPRLDRHARAEVAERNAGLRPAPAAASGGSVTSGSTLSTSTIRRAPTSARVILSTASPAVRSGITRKAAYP